MMTRYALRPITLHKFNFISLYNILHMASMIYDLEVPSNVSIEAHQNVNDILDLHIYGYNFDLNFESLR